MKETETLKVLNQRFRNCCRIILKEEIGDVWEYDGYLSGMIDKNRHETSHVSGKDVVLGIKEYSKGAKFISHDEIDYGKKYSPVELKGIGSISSLAAALSERIAYAGNLVIGKSSHVESSTNISDSFFVYDSAQFGDSKYLYKCTVGRECEDCFGSHGLGETQFCIRCTQTYKDRRCFEAWMTQNCSDVYYSFNLTNCSECIFCFNLKGKSHCIGNVQLTPDEYSMAKARLLSEIAEKLKKGKKIPSLVDILEKCRYEKPTIPPLEGEKEGGGLEEVEKAFTKTAKLVLGTELSGIDDYSNWLYRHAHNMEMVKSAASGKKMLFLDYITALISLPRDRMVSMEEALWLGENSSIGKADAMCISLGNAHQSIGKIGFFPVEFREGKNPFITDCLMSLHTSYCYRTSGMVYAKYCACGMWPRSSEHCFGFDTMWSCSFCINCYHSVSLTRCFECDSCHSCSDSYFCHNSENLRDCMFCFNVKNLRYAIGNAEVGKEKYLRVKKIVLDEIAAKLAKDKKLEWSIYNIGAKK